MTLVAAIMSDGSTPFMISDTLLSSEANSETPVTHPTKPEFNPEQGLRIVGLSQKVVEILPNLFVGWSGDYDAAGRFMTNLRLFSSGKEVTSKSLSNECKIYFEFLHPNDAYRLSIITLFYDNNFYYHATYNSALKTSSDQLGDVTVIGSGSKPFLEYISKVPLSPPELSNVSAPSNANMIQYFLFYILQTQNYQKSTGFGLKEGWGGGFELVLSKSGRGFQKLDRVVYLTFVWWFEGALLRTSWMGSRYFLYISGIHLNILSQERHKSLKQHIAAPPDYPLISGEQELNVQQRVPQLACIALTNRDTGKSRVLVEYAENGLSWCGIAEFSQMGESIRVSSEYLDRLIRFNAGVDAV